MANRNLTWVLLAAIVALSAASLWLDHIAYTQHAGLWVGDKYCSWAFVTEIAMLPFIAAYLYFLLSDTGFPKELTLAFIIMALLFLLLILAWEYANPTATIKGCVEVRLC